MAGQLATASFDHQHPQAPDNRMQRPNLNARNEISPWIRWEGMQVYVVQEQKTYQLVGGTGNEHWQEIAAGGGASNFVGQFPTFEDLPDSGSPGDYAYVGTGDDFVQYNWDQIAGEWRLNSAETKVSDEDFFLGRVPSEPDRVMFSMRRNSIIYSTGGTQSISPDRMANYVFTGENVTLENVNYDTEGNEEFHITNRTGSNLTILSTGNFASGLTIPAGHMASFKSSDDGWVQSYVNEDATFSDTLDSVNARISTGPDGKDVLSGIFDNTVGEVVTFKEFHDDAILDGVMFIQHHGKKFKRTSPNGVNIKWFGAIGDGITDDTLAFKKALLFAKNYYWAVTLLIPEGRYKISSSLSLDYDKCRIRGEGIGISVIEYYYEQVDTTSSYVQERINSCFVTPDDYINNLVLRDFSIEYRGTYHIPDPLNYYSHGYGAISGMLIKKAKGVILKNIEISGFNDCGVRFDTINMPAGFGNSSDVKINDCKLHNNHFANVLCRNVDGINVNGNYFLSAGSNLAPDLVGTTGYGLAFSAGIDTFSKNIIITDNKFYDNNRKGLDSHGCGDISVIGNIFSGNRAYQCAIVYNSGPAIITGNTFENHQPLPHFEGKPAYRFCSLDIGRPSNIADNGITDYKINITGNIWKDINISTGNTFILIGIITDAQNMGVNFSNNDVKADNLHILLKASLNLNNSKNKLSLNSNNINVSGSCYEGAFVLNGIEKYKIIGNEINIGKQGVLPDGTTYTPINPFDFEDINDVKEIIYIGNSLDGEKWDGNSFIDPEDAAYEPVDSFLFMNSVSRTKVISDLNWINGTRDLMRGVGEIGIPRYDGTNISFITGNFGSYIRADGTTALFGPSVRDVTLPLFSPINVEIEETDSIFNALRKSQGQIDSIKSDLSRESIDVDGMNYSFSVADFDKYVRFTGVAGNANIVLNRFASGVELVGEVEGGQKTIIGDPGVTLRYPAGGTNVAPTNSRFFIKFKSPNDAQLTIVPGAGVSVPDASTTERGIIELATSLEVINGSDEERAITPKLAKDHYLSMSNTTSTSTGTLIIQLPVNVMFSKVYFTSSGSVVLHGLSTLHTDRELVLVNKTPNDLTIVNQSTETGVSAPFDIGADLMLPPNRVARFEVIDNVIRRAFDL